MEDKNTEENQRTSLFTVRSAEVAVLTFAMLTLGYLIIGMLYQKNLMGKVGLRLLSPSIKMAQLS